MTAAFTEWRDRFGALPRCEAVEALRRAVEVLPPDEARRTRAMLRDLDEAVRLTLWLDQTIDESKAFLADLLDDQPPKPTTRS